VFLAEADQTDDYLNQQMQEHRIPGAALVVIKGGQVIKTATYGLADLEQNVPVKPETVFEIGSITKQFTAAGILLLAQDGKLSVDDKISLHLKELPHAWTNITVRHLLSHTSGIKNYTGLSGFELTKHLTQKQFLELTGKQSRDFQPGDSFRYCNTGFNLLGFIIENVSGQRYWDFMAERIFRPVGMNSTTERVPGKIIPNRAHGYEHTNHLWINRDYDLTDIFSAGAIASTIGDLSKWNAALDGTNLLGAATKERMWTPAKLNSGKPTKYGFGWFVDTFEGHKNIYHGGSTSGFSASIQRFPDDQLAVVLLTNTDEQIATTVARKVGTLYFRN
jgi:CubicO group peptidase (beta-lactamase class C family)